MDLTIQRLNGEVYTLSDYGIMTLDFRIDAPSPRVFSEVIDGRDGIVDMGAVYEGRAAHGSFYITVPIDVEYPQLRNDVFRMFASREQFYVIDSREPGRRWLVRSNGFSPEQITANKGRFDVEFTSAKPYAESVLNTLDNAMTAAQFTSTGSRLVAYAHTTSTFEIFNEGDAIIDPRELPLVITFKGASTNLKIENLTTGDVWQYTGNTTASDTVKLDGVRATKNGLSIFRNTNRKLITIVTGWNDFKITGATAPFEITFDFRFYTI